MSTENYKLKLENLQLRVQQNPSPTAIAEYLEARIQLLEGLVLKLFEDKP